MNRWTSSLDTGSPLSPRPRFTFAPAGGEDATRVPGEGRGDVSATGCRDRGYDGPDSTRSSVLGAACR